MKRRGWWDIECREKKSEVRRVLREWRKGNRGRRGVQERKKRI